MILVVDDDEAIREAVVEVLHEAGYEVAQAHNGAEALGWLAAAERPPQLVLLDLMMPVMDGWEFLKAVAVDESLRAIPVVVLSASGLGRAPSEVAGFLRKPFGMDALLGLVAEHVPAPSVILTA